MTERPPAATPSITLVPDPRRCPLCGGPNGCAMACGGGTAAADPCWCTTLRISPQTLARIPTEARGAACLCRACATGATDQTATTGAAAPG